VLVLLDIITETHSGAALKNATDGASGSASKLCVDKSMAVCLQYRKLELGTP
jgi:hypothetical protein